MADVNGGAQARAAVRATTRTAARTVTRRLSRGIIAGVVAVLVGVIVAVLRANLDPRITQPLASYPEITIEPDQTVRKADMFSLFGTPMDFQVYYYAGRSLGEGLRVYEDPFVVTNWGQGYKLPFTYPPFAAWLASLYAKLPLGVASTIWQVASLLILIAVVAAVLVGKRGRGASVLPRLGIGGVLCAVLLVAASFAFAPVRSSFYWGQVNVLVMGLVALDFLGGRHWDPIRANGWREDSWWAGIGVGLAAALKVYPAFFGLLFLLQRRWRAAITSGVTFFVTVALGFAFVPESGEYWSKVLTDTTRFGGLKNVTSQSIQVSLMRDFGIDSTPLWLVLAVFVTAAAAFAARRALRLGEVAIALSLIGLAACVVSPFAWHHYYLWAITLVIAAGLGLLTWFSRFHLPTATLPGVLIGAAVTAGCVAALWPYVSVVFFYPFDVYALSTSSNPFVASATAWWSVLLIVVFAVALAVVPAKGRNPGLR